MNKCFKTIFIILLFWNLSILFGASFTWKNVTSIPGDRSNYVAVAANDKIYIIGGSHYVGNFNIDLATVEEYDPEAAKWTTKANMPKASETLSALIIDNKIYVCDVTNKIIEKYDPTDDTWTTVTSIPKNTTYYGTAVAANDKIYLIDTYGGFLSEYNIEKNTWIYKAAMPFKHHNGITVQSVNNNIYILGGVPQSIPPAAQFNVYEYYPSADVWTFKNTIGPEYAKCYMASVIFNDKIYAFGGTNPNAGPYFEYIYPDNQDTILMYDTKLDNISYPDNLPRKVSRAQAVKVNEKVYLIGGYSAENKPYRTIEEGTLSDLTDLAETTPLDMIKIFPQPLNTAKLYIINLPNVADIKVFSIAGELIRKLDYTDQSGAVSWDVKNTGGQTVTSGVYIISIDSPVGKKKLKVAVEK